MNSLVTLPNIGDTLAQKLNRIGITNFEQLKTIGSKEALIKISTLENSGACLICFMPWKVPSRELGGMD